MPSRGKHPSLPALCGASLSSPASTASPSPPRTATGCVSGPTRRAEAVAGALRLRLLHWTVAGVLGLQGLALALLSATGADAAVPAALRVGLGLAEAGGAIL